MPDKLSTTTIAGLGGVKDLIEGKPVERVINQNLLSVLSPISSAVVVRREDFLFLSFFFAGFGLRDKATASPTLVRTDKTAYIVVVFPQQSIGERAFYEGEPAGGFKHDPNKPPEKPDEPTFPAPAMLSGPSWLTFRIPESVTSIPYTLEALLDWGKWEPVTAPADGVPKDGSLPSAVEAPFRLLLSPQRDSVWRHELAPPAAGAESFDLWHTRHTAVFRVQGRGTFETLASVRAAWARDFDPASGPGQSSFKEPFRQSLTPRQRTELVLLTSTASGNFKPRPVEAHRLMLTSLGAYLDLRGDWDDQYRAALNSLLPAVIDPTGAAPLIDLPDVAVSAWRHTATLGRDHYVRVVEEGSLFPFGHRAALVTITERRFHVVGRAHPLAANYAATLFQKMFVVVREPVRDMRSPAAVEGGDLVNSLLPFKRVRIEDATTPAIDPPGLSQKARIGVFADSAFWVVVGGSDYRFNLVGEDWEGRACEFSLPLVFASDALTKAEVSTLIDAYHKSTPADRRRGQTSGRMVAFAPTDNTSAGDTSYETRSLTFGARASGLGDQQRFRPALAAAEVRVTAVEQMVGARADIGIAYAETYLKSGFDAKDAAGALKNKGAIFARVVGDLPALSFSGKADRAGGLATPNMIVAGLSRRTGVIGGGHASTPDSLAAGDFNPSHYFNLDAKILGGINLGDIVAAMTPGTFDAARMPRLNTSPVFEQGASTPSALETTLEWKPKLITNHSVLACNEDSLTLAATIRSDPKAGKHVATITGTLKPFSLRFAGAIEIYFESLTFTQHAGSKLDVSVVPDLKSVPPRPCVRFMGPLAFLNQLAALVDPVGLSDPPSLEVGSDGARLGYTLGLPPLTIGAYAIQNVTLGAALNIPFKGDPVRVRFNFCERHSPFLLTVSGFAGGGFVALALGADGIEGIESALEFGGNVALHLGVASGGVCVMGGFYFGSSKNALTFTAYVRANGVLEVLSLVAISTEFYLGLTYSKVGQSNRFWGQATVTVEVEVAFFSKSVSLTVEREFAGGDGDPTFQQLMSEKQYVEEYRAAFAG